MTTSNEVPLMFQAQVQGRGQIQYMKNPQQAYRWVDEWVEGASVEVPQFSLNVRTKEYKITWRFISNSGQDEDVIRPVIAAKGFPFYPGASMKGAFLRSCTSHTAKRYCGGQISAQNMQPGILRFHGAYPQDANWGENPLVDVIHPQENWQVKNNDSHAAFIQISLYQPTLVFGISSTVELEESEWETVWSIWDKAIERGIGSRVSAGYGQPIKHPETKLVSVGLRGQGLASQLCDKAGEFRPNMFKAALRGHTLRLFSSVTDENTAEELTRELWGGFAEQNSAEVGLLGIAFNAIDLEMDSYTYGNVTMPTYDLINGTLNILCMGSVSEDDRKNLKRLATQLVKFSPGTLTLVICNRVSRAQALFKELEKQVSDEVLLVHSRFRPKERQELNKRLHGIISAIFVATQVVEAGVDISARTLFTELAPWSSLVQRIGRCNRYAECSDSATVYWVDIELNKKRAASPYEDDDLEEARTLLSPLTDVSPESLQQVKAKLKDPEGLIPRRHDLLQLFDTSTDLAGHDIDISPFIRETNGTDIAIAWRNWHGNQPEGEEHGALRQEELCRVSLWRARELLEDLKKQQRFAWVWDGLQGEWVKATTLYPGMSLLLHCSDGGYSLTLGFTGNLKDQPEPVKVEAIEPDQDDADPLTYQAGAYVTLVDHSQDVALLVRQLCESLSEYGLRADLLERAGRWHDLGKAHPVFQEMMIRDRPDKVEGVPWAKSEQKTRIQKGRQGFRHELVSAIVALQHGEDFLLTYLIAAHHGKVRLSIQPRNPKNKPTNPEKKYAFGVEEGDQVPAVDLGNGLVIPQQTLSLDCMALGDGEYGPSWTARALDLLEEHGPFKLAFLETMIRIADWRASAKYAADILRKTDA